MTLAVPVKSSWSYDFGEVTSAGLNAQAAPAIDAELSNMKSQAVTQINTGNFGVAGSWGTAAQGTYRVIARADANSPQGYSLEVRQVTT